ncbi:MAG: protein kinase [Kofleriaceae bacterium]
MRHALAEPRARAPPRRAMTDDGESLVGKKLGAYRIECLLGTGGMGEVYRALHEVLGRSVAIKTLKPAIAADAKSVERFFAEARAVNLIRHENIVEVTDLVNEPGGPRYLVMELLDGQTLGELLRDVGPLAPARAVRIAGQIASAIAAAHDKDIIHRDLKPDNVFLIRRAGVAEYVKVLDFGVARLRPDLGGVDATASGMMIGTPAYMAPEQARGERARVGVSADIYALGVIVFHMLTGRLPFEGNSLAEVLVGHQAQDPPPVSALISQVPPALAALVARALAKQPEDRPASMRELRRELFASVGLEGELVEDAPVTAGPPATRPGSLRAGASDSPSLWSGATLDVSAAAIGPRAEEQAPREPPTSGEPPASGPPAPRSLIESSPPPSSVGEGDERGPRVATAAPLSSDRGSLPRRPRLRGYARVAIGAGLVVALAAALAVVVLTRRAPPSGERGPRAALAAAAAGHHEPPTPLPCQCRDENVLAELVRASKLLRDGAPSSRRASDQEAATSLSIARELPAASKEPEYWHWVARARLFLGAPTSEVTAAAETAIALCPTYAAAHNLLGTARFNARDLVGAERAYRAAIELDPTYVAPLANLGLMQIDRRDLVEGIATQTAVLARDPTAYVAYLSRGQAYLWRNELERAAADLEQAARLEPARVDAFWLLGNAYQGLGRSQDANAALCRAAKLGHPEAAERCASDAAAPR